MRNINAKQLAAAAGFGIRADFVRRDPAVQASARQALADLRTAAESSRALIFVVGDSWARSESSPAYAFHNRVAWL